ncbi:PREDICTED: uncharacterized protein C15orf61 homolog [Papilio xuthus]|uniref:Uncharacterized protein C15orf61 homolog n=1 Tax=Papilio xuthus TaxID=66420 RepID=A0AAJ7E608_PAPXU|nr:PREDICTED: uncharacterized protein C15orf61 homolog [Papilio xuthus]
MLNLFNSNSRGLMFLCIHKSVSLCLCEFFVMAYFLGIPCLLYGLAAIILIHHSEIVYTSKGQVTIYFLLEEHKGSLH